MTVVFAHLTIILSLHYLVKCRSRSLAIYKNEFILGSACVGSEMTNWIAINKTVSQKVMCYITSALLQHVLKIFSSSTNISGGR